MWKKKTKWRFGVLGCTWRETISTCVLESDFGFMLNCVFKKSSLFRVRNLGGVKGYVGLGECPTKNLDFFSLFTVKNSRSERGLNPEWMVVYLFNSLW